MSTLGEQGSTLVIDARTQLIVQAMALGPIAGDDMHDWCPHCEATASYDEQKDFKYPHEPSCPVLLARALLREWGTPLRVYEVSCERLWKKTAKRQFWKACSGYTFAISEQTAIQSWTNEETRNITAIFIRLLEEEKQS
jgi:hypothetical protein